MQKYIDVRSDTVTHPTPAMRLAMMEAPVGDDVFMDDPTILELEQLAASTLGKEAALFVPSGTMGNQLAIMSQTTPGDEIIAGANCHIVHYELAAPARLSGVAYALVQNPDDTIRPEDVVRLTRPKKDILSPQTSLLCLENALCNGAVVPLEIIQASYAAAKKLGLAVHMDGARIFNAALALGVDAKEIAACGDTVMFCVSKGLCAPVGSLLCGSKEVIDTARHYRKMLGGGMRQAGVLAACGIIALEVMTQRLQEDHDNARLLGELLAKIPGITVNMDKIQINMVFFKTTHLAFSSEDFIAFLLDKGIKALGSAGTEYRMVTNHGVSQQDVHTIANAVAEYLGTLPTTN